MRELLLEIGTSVRRNKLRTALTGFSVAWGIFMLVILLGSGNGLKNGVLSNLGNYAINSIDLYGGRTSKPWKGYEKGRRIRLNINDLEILQREFPEIDKIAAKGWYSAQAITRNDKFANASLCGALPQTAEIEGIELAAGRYINEEDIRRFRKSIIIDEPLQRLLFKDEEPLGKQIKLDGLTFTVVGVYKGDAQRTNSTCYIPLTTGQLIYKANDLEINTIAITVQGIDTDKAMDDFEQRLLRRLAAEHDFAPDDKSALWIDNTLEHYKSMMIVFGGINLFVWIIGMGTLLAGIVGVSNIMLVLVKERTQEIGIRRAIGAPPAAIIGQILSESFVLTFVAGTVGLAAGVGLLSAADTLYAAASPEETVEGVSWQITFATGMLSLAILLAGSLLAGIIPAVRALSIKAVDAIREE